MLANIVKRSNRTVTLPNHYERFRSNLFNLVRTRFLHFRRTTHEKPNFCPHRRPFMIKEFSRCVLLSQNWNILEWWAPPRFSYCHYTLKVAHGNSKILTSPEVPSISKMAPSGITVVASFTETTHGMPNSLLTITA